MEEFEIKFLNVDVPMLEARLVDIGAEKSAEFDYRITLFDYPDLRLDKEEAWIKLRTDAGATTLSYKKRLGVKSNDGDVSDEGMKEIEIVVDSYEKTYQMLIEIGLIVKREMEKRRVRYKKGEAVYDIDFWPRIPPCLEVEADSLEAAKHAAVEIGFNPDEGLIASASQIFMKYGIDPRDYTYMTFEKFVKKGGEI